MPIKLFNTKDMTEREWLEHRKAGIGGSDASAILGINKWKSPLQLYLEKIGDLEGEDLSDNEAVHFGHKLEDVVAREFAERTGWTVRRNNFILQHETNKFMLANIDREVIHPERGKGVLEIKTTSAWNADQWQANEVPNQYMIQVQHYLAVTGLDFAYIAVLIGGNKYDHWLIERDQELIDIIIEAERHFWENHVLKNVPPALDYNSDAQLLERLYPSEEKDSVIDLTNDFEVGDILTAIETNEQEVKRLKAVIEADKTKLKERLAEKEKAIHDYGTITWKQTKPTEYVAPKELQEKYPDVWNELKKERKASRRFTIKLKKEN